jgi:hypothetical protein
MRVIASSNFKTGETAAVSVPGREKLAASGVDFFELQS